MSRRDRRDSDSRRYRSRRFDEEPSPKRSRRDGKPETERPPTDVNLDRRENSDRDQKHRQKLQDALPLQAPKVSEEQAGSVRKESNRFNTNHEGRKQSKDLTDAPRSQSYFQHDERGNSDQVKRSSDGKESTGRERGWWRDPQEQLSERANRISTNNMQKKEERSRVQGDNKEAWRHDRYYDMVEADPRPPVRKRPSFTEKKISHESEKAKASLEEEEPIKTDANDHHSGLENEKRDNRSNNNNNNPRHMDRAETTVGDRDTNRGGAAGSWRGNFASRDRQTSHAGNYHRGRDRERDRFSARQGYNPMGNNRVEKWKHDLFDEANRSPSPKKDEDVVAKVEALLAS